MAPRIPPKKNDSDESDVFVEMVGQEESQAARRGQILDTRSILFRGSVVVTIIGGVWGVAVSFSSFKYSQEETHKEVTKLRVEFDRLKGKVMYLKELDLWSDAMRRENETNKVIVPKPSDYKVQSE